MSIGKIRVYSLIYWICLYVAEMIPHEIQRAVVSYINGQNPIQYYCCWCIVVTMLMQYNYNTITTRLQCNYDTITIHVQYQHNAGQAGETESAAWRTGTGLYEYPFLTEKCSSSAATSIMRSTRTYQEVKLPVLAAGFASIWVLLVPTNFPKRNIYYLELTKPDITFVCSV